MRFAMVLSRTQLEGKLMWPGNPVKLTVIVRDNYDPLGDPLIYAVKVTSLDHEAILWAVTEARLADLGEEVSPDNLDLDLLFAFAGDLSTVADWRE
jgi:hypothetical protein